MAPRGKSYASMTSGLKRNTPAYIGFLRKHRKHRLASRSSTKHVSYGLRSDVEEIYNALYRLNNSSQFSSCGAAQDPGTRHYGKLPPRNLVCQSSGFGNENQHVTSRRDVLLQSSSFTTLAAIFNFSGTRPDYLGVQKKPPSLALCPPTPNCISTSEVANDPSHYVPPWTYNPEDGRERKNPATKEQAMAELIDAITSTKPGNFTPRIVKRTDDYVYVEYESPILGFIDDVEFWFPPGNRSLVEYRSASRLGHYDFGANRKRIKALREALEKKGWQSTGL